MFSTKDKVKELVEFFVQNTDISCLICQNHMYKPVGVSVVMTYKFDVNDMEIIYEKWYVENYESAVKMNLQGCEHHNQLVKGSGVIVLSRKLGSYVFHGKDANDIINACESGRNLNQYILCNQKTIQR